MKLRKEELKEFLDEKAEEYNRPSFIEDDPISIPHRFSGKEDREISGFLTAAISWGRRSMILANAAKMMDLLNNSPYEFIMNAGETDFAGMKGFVHRTFDSADLIYFIKALKHIYSHRGGLEEIFTGYMTEDSLQPAIHELHNIFFELPHSKRTEGHVPDPYKGSAAKRINMLIRIIKVAINQNKLVHLALIQ
mgnify:FL=1